MRMKLTPSIKIENLKPPTTGELLVWDEGLAGFGLRVGRRRRTWIVQYRIGTRTRRLTLGHWPTLSLAAARAKAAAALATVDLGEDPAAEDHQRAQTPTLAAFAERYRVEYAEAQKRPHSIASEVSLLRAHLLPAFGAKRLDAIRPAEVQRFHAGLRTTPYVANRCMALLRHMLKMARRWGVLEAGLADPTAGVTLYREAAIERFLSAEEAARLGTALQAEESRSPIAVAAIRLLALTGARASEIRCLRWSEVDLAGACLRLPAARTKEKRSKRLPLTAPALAVLNALPRLHDEWVFPGTRDRPMRLQAPWERVRAAAQLERGGRFRLHDLRHSFATEGVGAGMSLALIGALMGHRRPSTTARYGHASDDPRREAAERIASRVAASLEGREPAEVVPLRSA
jgi:integrase